MMAEEVNNLQPEIKEETEEEKIDIENHFLPVISSCEEDQLARLVWCIMNKASFLVTLMSQTFMQSANN